MDNNINNDAVTQPADNQERAALLNSLSFSGLEVNPVISSSLHLVLLAKKISEGKDFAEKEIEDFKKDFINEILSISAKLSTLAIHLIRNTKRPRLAWRISEPTNKIRTFLFFG